VPADLRRHFGDCIFSTDLVASYEAPGVPISHIVLLPPDVPNENTGNIPNAKAFVRKSSGVSVRSAGVGTPPWNKLHAEHERNESNRVRLKPWN